MVTAYVGLGSNLHNPVRQLKRALVQIQRLPGTTISAISPFYRNPALLPEGVAEPQPAFVNAVAELRTALPPRSLLRMLLHIEHKQGRRRSYRWAPRTLDLDLLLYGQQCLQTSELILPHPELWRRAFVLYPLRDIAPALRVPRRGCVQNLLARVKHQARIPLADVNVVGRA